MRPKRLRYADHLVETPDSIENAGDFAAVSKWQIYRDRVAPFGESSLQKIAPGKRDFRRELIEAVLSRNSDSRDRPTTGTKVDWRVQVGWYSRRPIRGVAAGHDGRADPCIHDTLGEHPDVRHLRERHGIGIERYLAESGLEAHDSAECGRNSHRSRGIAANRSRAQPEPYRSSGAAAAASGGTGEIERVPGDSRERAVCHSLPREFRRSGLTDEDGARIT